MLNLGIGSAILSAYQGFEIYIHLSGNGENGGLEGVSLWGIPLFALVYIHGFSEVPLARNILFHYHHLTNTLAPCRTVLRLNHTNAVGYSIDFANPSFGYRFFNLPSSRSTLMLPVETKTCEVEDTV